MSHLFSPFQIRNIRLKNRIVLSPMCQYSSRDGFSNNWHLVHLGSRAVGGAGLIFTEAAAVSPEGRITPDDLGIWKDAHIKGLQEIVDFIVQQGAVPAIQLAHAGRKASHNSPWKGGKSLPAAEGWITLAPSALGYSPDDAVPHEMSVEDIKNVQNEFATAAERALQAGFKIIEIHAAHGYLLNEFLSPLSNKRTDEYGGSFENRIRILLEITETIKGIIGELPLFVRISATDWVQGGWQIEDSVLLSRQLKATGADLVDCSSGGNSQEQKIPLKPMYQVEFANRIIKEAGIATGAVGLITTAEEAEGILARGEADLIFMARQLLREPYFPLNAAARLQEDILWPPPYARAKNR